MRTRSLLATTLLFTALGLDLSSLASADVPPPPPARSSRSTPTRVRLGLELGVGPVLGDSRGGAFSLVGALGVQFNDTVALFWQPAASVYGWGTDDIEVFAFGSQLAMLDFTLGRALQLGVGGGIDHGRFGVCTGRSAGSCAYQSREVQPALEARVAVIIPLPGIRARWGIPISGRFHVTWFENRQVMAVLVTLGLIRY